MHLWSHELPCKESGYRKSLSGEPTGNKAQGAPAAPVPGCLSLSSSSTRHESEGAFTWVQPQPSSDRNCLRAPCKSHLTALTTSRTVRENKKCLLWCGNKEVVHWHSCFFSDPHQPPNHLPQSSQRTFKKYKSLSSCFLFQLQRLPTIQTVIQLPHLPPKCSSLTAYRVHFPSLLSHWLHSSHEPSFFLCFAKLVPILGTRENSSLCLKVLPPDLCTAGFFLSFRFQFKCCLPRDDSI